MAFQCVTVLTSVLCKWYIMTVNKGSFYLILNWHRWMKSFIMKPRDFIGLHTYYHDWGTDQTRNHDINNGCIVTLLWQYSSLRNRNNRSTVYPKKYAHGFCFAVLCCGYTLADFPISIRLTSLALWQSNDCPSASKATLMNMDKYFMWIHYERLHNHNKAKHKKNRVHISWDILYQ